MNRRSFLKKLGIGAAAATTVAAAPELCHSLCSSWCTEHAAPVSATIGEYYDYANFSSFAIDESWDKMLSDAAIELGQAASLSIKELYRVTFDGEVTNGQSSLG